MVNCLRSLYDGSPEYGLYEVVGQAHDETQGQLASGLLMSTLSVHSQLQLL